MSGPPPTLFPRQFAPPPSCPRPPRPPPPRTPSSQQLNQCLTCAHSRPTASGKGFRGGSLFLSGICSRSGSVSALQQPSAAGQRPRGHAAGGPQRTVLSPFSLTLGRGTLSRKPRIALHSEKNLFVLFVQCYPAPTNGPCPELLAHWLSLGSQRDDFLPPVPLL